MFDRVGAVAIGRNEGERLKTCLNSLLPLVPRLVYVDSGSSDGSVEFARGLGADVVELDTSQGFTAARARNAGVKQLVRQHPDLDYVQFVDGDCEVIHDWLTEAIAALDANEKLAAVCGRRRERYPEQTIYNRLCDLEWDTPVGETGACGGDAMLRIAAFHQVGGFNERLIAGEEPELCIRMRAARWKIERLKSEMTLHDAAMSRLSQWFRRAQRAGHAYAEWVTLHGAPPERAGVRESRSIWFWAAVWPTLLALLAVLVSPWVLLGLGAYPAWMLKTAINRRRSHHDAWPHCLLFGASCITTKFPQWLGQLTYYRNRLRGQTTSIIEYKS